MKFEVEKEMVEPIIRDQIATAVVAQMGNLEEVVKKAVELALSVKVNSDGVLSKYSYENTLSFVESISGKALREAATEAIVQVVEDQKPMIRKAVEDHLRRSPRKTAAAIVDAFANSIEAGKFSPFSVKFEFPER